MKHFPSSESNTVTIEKDVYKRQRYLVTDYEVDRSDEPVVIDESVRYGVCDETGKMVIPAEYDSIEMLAWNHYWVNKGEKWGMIDESEQWLATVDTDK